MKQTRLSIAALLALSALLIACAAEVDSAGQAQPPLAEQAPPGDEVEPPAEERIARRLERMRRHLDLTDAQVEQLRPILVRAHERHRRAREETRAELAQVLTPEQLARVERHLERRRHGRRGPRGMRGNPMERMRHHLDLTDEQVAQVEPILRAAHERGRSLRDLPPEERRVAMEALRAEVRQDLSAILSDEQLQKLEEAFERRARRWRRRHAGDYSM